METPENRPVPRHADGLTRRVVRTSHNPEPINSVVPATEGGLVFSYKQPNRKKWFSFPPKINGKKALKIAGGLIGLVALIFAIQLIVAGLKVITGNTSGGSPLFGKFDVTKLKGEGDGRINILLLGIGGAGHQAPDLSDTVMVASIDPRTKDVAMLSIPRDLWVPIPGYGSAKINAAHAYGEMYKKKVAGGGPALAKETVSKMLDLPIHYFVRIDFTGFQKAIDAVGGIDVVVDEAIYDPAYPCDGLRGYCPFSLKAGPQHLNGTVALKYARSRQSTSDFDRAARQQKVLVALRQKALDLQTLTNPAKISSLINSIGGHIKTDFQPNEIKKLASIVKDVDPAKLVSKVLDTSEDGLLVANSGDQRGYIELPRTGNFEEIRQFVHGIFIDGYIKEEAATIEIQNGTSRDSLATTVGKQLKGYNYNVIKTTTADQKFTETVLYDYSGGKKPVTIKYLEQRFGVKAQRVSEASPETDIKIILGANYKGMSSEQ